MEQRHQVIQGKQVEVKWAKTRENRKVFVGGLDPSMPAEDLAAYFATYGKVTKWQHFWP